jgi:hypothetical protein
MSLFALALLPVTLAGAPLACSAEALQNAHADGIAAFEAMDAQALGDAYALADATLRCLDVPMTPEASARHHLLQGLWSYHSQEREAAAQAFAAARALDPALHLPDQLAPPGGDLSELFLGGPSPMDSAALPGLGEGAQWWVDGTATLRVPVGSPAVLQLDTGDTLFSAYQWPGAALPSWAELPAQAMPLAESPPRSARVAKALGLGALGTGLASAACFGSSALIVHRVDQSAATLASTNDLPDYVDPEVTGLSPSARLDQLAHRATRLSQVSRVGAGVTLGLTLGVSLAWSR